MLIVRVRSAPLVKLPPPVFVSGRPKVQLPFALKGYFTPAQRQAFGKVANMAPTFGGDLVLVACIPGRGRGEVPRPDAESDTCSAIDFPAYTKGRARRLTKDEKVWVDRNAGSDPQQVAYGERLPVASVARYMAKTGRAK